MSIFQSDEPRTKEQAQADAEVLKQRLEDIRIAKEKAANSANDRKGSIQ